ncbi:hypothetical protein LPJ73_002588 [Coemansia sp. RSA 2703]|nr:hypothetical protein LPJ73_002588 [Coemansia sp. RSA 2703]
MGRLYLLDLLAIPFKHPRLHESQSFARSMRSQRSNGNTPPAHAHEQQQQQQQQQTGLNPEETSTQHNTKGLAEAATTDNSETSQNDGKDIKEQDDDDEEVTDSANEYPATGPAFPDRHHSRFMLPRASGLSTMGDIRSFVHSPVDRSSALLAPSLPAHDQGSVYPATWHEYEDQFNYFYNCHFIEQDYYDYLATGYPQAGGMAASDSSSHDIDRDDASDQDMDYYSDGSASALDAVDEDIGDIDVHMSSVNDASLPEPANESSYDCSQANIDSSSSQK